MNGEKITISLDDINSAEIDAVVKRQEISTKMAAHQARIESTTSNASRINSSGFFRRSIVYMAIFGLVASAIGWVLGEVCQRTAPDWLCGYLWGDIIAVCVSVGLAVAEPVVSRNSHATLVNGIFGAAFGCVGGVVGIFTAGLMYMFLGGHDASVAFMQQVFARGIGWSILGMFVAIAPGIVMRSGKRFGLGLAGGAIGGLIGGMLFDLICELSGSDVPARCVNIIGLGIGAAVATALLENLAKQGWLRVATGVITGKQFILYRNPTIIGSSPKSEIYLFKDPSVSARHAAINGIGGNFIVTALGGATVLLNGQPVKQQTLKNGDQLRIGNTIFLFEARVIKKVNR